MHVNSGVISFSNGRRSTGTALAMDLLGTPDLHMTLYVVIGMDGKKKSKWDVVSKNKVQSIRRATLLHKKPKVNIDY